jgi:hypothetical protein
LFRQILLPGAILMGLSIGACGFGLWDLFHAQFSSSWNPSEAYGGDIAAQQRLASCYSSGCVTVPHDPDFACAWRTIIADEEKSNNSSNHIPDANGCSHLSPSARKTVSALVADIRRQMREDADIHLQPHDKGWFHPANAFRHEVSTGYPKMMYSVRATN